MEQRHREIALKRPREHCQNAPVFSLSNSPYVNYPRNRWVGRPDWTSRLPEHCPDKFNTQSRHQIVTKSSGYSKNDQPMNSSNTTIGALHVLIVSNVSRICALCVVIFASQTRAAKGYQATFSL